MKDTYYIPSAEVEKKAEEYMKKIDAEIQASKNTVAGLERRLGDEKLRLD